MRVNGWFDGINVWKIHTLGDLIFYVLLILLGVLIFFRSSAASTTTVGRTWP